MACAIADLHTLRGLSPVVNLLTHDSPDIQAAAAYVLGTAASNNNHFHDQLMQIHPASITFLMQVRNKMQQQEQTDMLPRKICRGCMILHKSCFDLHGAELYAAVVYAVLVDCNYV